MTSALGTPQNSALGDYFRNHAAAIDGPDGDVRTGLRHLGARDLLGLPLLDTVSLVEDIAGECLSSAFSVWAHRMVIEYLARSRTTELIRQLEPSLRAADVIGATAMAPALRDVAGLEPVPVRAERESDGLRLNGPIHWASHLFPDAVVVLPVRLPDHSRAVVLIRTSAEGVDVAASPSLFALNATRSSSATLRDVVVPPDAVLSDDMAGFVRSVRPAFLVLQTAFCTGLALRSLREARALATGLNAQFTDQVTQQEQYLASVRDRLTRFARQPGQAAVGDLLRLRLHGGQVAGAATRLEATVRGGAGYLATSGTSRRLREAAFLPIQSPTEGQLRWELAHAG